MFDSQEGPICSDDLHKMRFVGKREIVAHKDDETNVAQRK